MKPADFPVPEPQRNSSVMALSVDIEPHRCSVCHVMLENLSEEECLKCDDPTAYLSYRDPTEVDSGHD